MTASVDFPDQIDLEHYQRVYPQIAETLGASRRTPTVGELRVLEKAAAIELPPGNVGAANLCFLAAVTSASHAARAIEIGTASGTSTALMAAVIAANLAGSGQALASPLVETIDKKNACLFDASKPIGFMVRELAPEVVEHVRIHTEQDSFLARTLVAPRSLGLTFVDGNHQHPWPLIDVLNLLPLMRQGAWMILHDIDLPAVAARLNIEARYGAQWLFDGWPAAKLASSNIGAVAMPDDPHTLRPFFDELARRPFEVASTGWKRYERMLADAFDFAFGR